MALLLRDVLDLKKRIDQTGFAARYPDTFEKKFHEQVTALCEAIREEKGFADVSEIDSLDPSTQLESEDVGILYNGLNMWFWNEIRTNEALQVNEMLHNRLTGKPTLDSLAH